MQALSATTTRKRKKTTTKFAELIAMLYVIAMDQLVLIMTNAFGCIGDSDRTRNARVRKAEIVVKIAIFSTKWNRK